MKDKRYHLAAKQIMCIVSAIAVLCLVIVFATKNNPVLLPGEATSATTESAIAATQSEEERNQIIRAKIDRTVSDWFSGAVTFEEASEILVNIQDTSSAELSDYAAQQLTYITVENDGNTLLELAQKFFGVKNYVQVLSKLNEIDPSYSKYDSVLETYTTCENQVLQAVASPSSKEDFESYIKLLEDCNNLYARQSFVDRQAQLSDELVIFLDISETIDAATIQFDSHNIQESFLLLTLGLEKYPDDERLATTLVNYRDHYVITTTRQAVELCQEKKYKEALQIVEAAIEEYDCDEFQMLREAIKEEKSFLYRLKNDIVDTFTSLADGWENEEFDVQQAANNAGAYIVKSGKKIALGDYTDEDVTLLSFSGNVAASVLGIDALFDLRDLSYDITHWGEEEYFAVWLTADVVALLPVIGVVKYFSHFKTAKNGLDAASELVDSAADIAKNTENASELAEAISDVTKIGDDIADAIDSAKDAAKVGETAKDIASDLTKEFTLISTINQKYLGKIHEESGVLYALSKAEYSDGRKIMGTFPVFESFATIQLPENLYKSSSSAQLKYCYEELKKELKKPWSKLRDNFTAEQIEDILNDVHLESFTWHHNEQEGIMELVDSLAHSQAKHTGGMSLWGRGY